MSAIRPPERVWDPLVRVFHWSLVSAVLLNQFVLEEGDPPHRWIGYAAAALVGLRLLWGLIGTRHARFSDFWPTPGRVRAHLHAWLRGERPHTPGHNPLGALMMLALMALVLLLGLTGWLQGTDRFWGNEALQELHEGLANTLIVLAGLHAAAAIVMGRIERTRLVKAMFTGTKEHY
ncbi:MAG: cytochrome b/b6 domain-containing protein [Hydrogenophaga sp.]|uniref:cytochrome b/b6 domain-containing protein n=1 Tax=Hydrogenophaga sp. TaxID=1904254 RepID=UPI001D6BB3FA|nr:cytochrome b/b6 domain-containing protein [Hydrogenophaga sp.]MBX3608385.1 cytochrome b/b6 domain-containing protein [Hydrogenophaga sp.]